MAIPIAYNLRNLMVRKTTTSMTALGIALSVAVLLAILALVEGLRTSLAACPWITVVASFGDGLSALNHLVQFHPGILIIDSNLLDEEVDALLVAVKAKQPSTRCLALVRSSSRNEQVLIHGAHAAISRNSSAQELQEALFRLAHDTIDRQTQ